MTTIVEEAPGKKSHRKKDAIESFISKPPVMVQPALSQLRYMILTDGLLVPQNSEDGQCLYRSAVWSILLRANCSDSGSYLKVVQRGSSDSYSKIRDDTFRTYAKDANFTRKVSEDALSRVLNAYVWRQEDRKRLGQASARRVMSRSQDTYVQGMNVLAAPFLYVAKSEAHAFFMFESLLIRHCPRYVQPTLAGVHSGAKLVDICLKIIDPDLYKHLHSKYLGPQIYAFPSIMTLSACTPPLSEVLILWDFLFAYGVNLNILFVIAQMNVMRESLLESSSPMSLLRAFPPLQAKEVIKLGLSFVAKLPDQVWDLVKRHPYDDLVDEEIAKLVN